MPRSVWRFATSVGAWINLALLVWFAARRDLLTVDRRLATVAAGKLAVAGCALAVALYAAERPVARLFADWTVLRDVMTLLVARHHRRASSTAAWWLALFGPQWLKVCVRGRAVRRRPAARRPLLAVTIP